MKTMLFFSSIILLAVFHEGKIVQAESMNESDASGSGSDDGNNTSYIIPFLSTSTLVAITSIELSTSTAILSPSPPPSPPTSTFTANSISFPTTSLPTAGTTTAIIEDRSMMSIEHSTSTAFPSPSPPPSPPTSTFIANSISFPTTSLPTAGTTTAIIEDRSSLAVISDTTSITTLAVTTVPTASTTIASSPVSSDATTSSLFMPDTTTTLFVATTSASSMTATSSAVAVFSVLSSSMPTASNLQFTTTVQPFESVAMSSSTVIPIVSTSIMLTPTLSFSSSVLVVAASSSKPSIQSSLSVSQLPSPSVAPPPPAGPLPIIAGAASGLCLIIVCIVFICIVCCCLRKRGKFELKSGKDGTTLAREYQLQPFHGVSVVAKQKENEATISTDTFGIQSPCLVEVDVGGQKFTFPDLPANGESLPALIIVNPVKPDEIFSNTYASRSSTLPSRKKNKVLANSDSVDITDFSLFGSQMKTSRSVSELNKDALPVLPTHIGLSSDQNASSMQCPIYDTPRTFKPLKSSEETENKSADASSNATDYVTMEPPSMTASQQPVPVEVNQQSAPVVTKKSAIVDRLAPKRSEAETESIYDNARLIRSNPLVAEKIFPVQTNSATTSSIYDVPRKLLAQAESSITKDTSTKIPVPVPSEIVAKTLSGGDLESVYDVPKINVKKETTKTSDISNTQPLYCNVVSKSEDVPQLFTKQNQTANESDKVKINSTVAAKDDSKAAKISIDEENSQADSTKKPLILPKSNLAKNPVVTTPDTSKDNTQADSSSNKPVILPKPSAVKNPVAVVSDTPKSEAQADGSNKPVLLPKPKNSFAMVSDTPKSETEAEGNSNKPVLLPKPTSANNSVAIVSDTPKSETKAESSINTKPVIQPKPKKSSTTDTPTVPPPKSTKPKVLSRKSDQKKSASPQCESSDESRRETETSSDNGTPEPMASGEEGQNALTPKPRTKPRKGTKRQVGLPQNLMQELFARQSSQSKLAETNALPTKPLVKPKPNMK